MTSSASECFPPHLLTLCARIVFDMLASEFIKPAPKFKLHIVAQKSINLPVNHLSELQCYKTVHWVTTLQMDVLGSPLETIW